MLMNELVKTELFSLLSESSQENTNEEMQSAKVILYSFEIQKYTQGIERKHQALRVLQEISTPALRSGYYFLQKCCLIYSLNERKVYQIKKGKKYVLVCEK